MKRSLMAAAAFVFAAAAAAPAQYAVPQQTSYAMNAAERANLQRFDMVRVDDGLIQEHWDVAFPNGIQR